MIRHREQTVDIGRKINADDLRTLVQDDIQESRVLMGKAVVILPPNGGGDQQIERRDGCPPWKLMADLEPFAMLVDHRIDHMDERLVGGKEPVTPSKQVAFQPPFQSMLT